MSGYLQVITYTAHFKIYLGWGKLVVVPVNTPIKHLVYHCIKLLEHYPRNACSMLDVLDEREQGSKLTLVRWPEVDNFACQADNI